MPINNNESFPGIAGRVNISFPCPECAGAGHNNNATTIMPVPSTHNENEEEAVASCPAGHNFDVHLQGEPVGEVSIEVTYSGRGQQLVENIDIDVNQV